MQLNLVELNLAEFFWLHSLIERHLENFFVANRFNTHKQKLLIFQQFLYLEALSEPRQSSKMELFAETIND